MNYNDKRSFYAEKYNRCMEEKNKNEKKYASYATIRAILFLLGVACLFIGLADKIMPAAVAGVVLFAGFVFAVRAHGIIAADGVNIKCRLYVLERYMKRFTNEWREFEENGSAYLKTDDTVSRDADILGSNSLFQLINVCHTGEGREKLAALLCTDESVLPEELIIRREAVAELAADEELGIEYEAAGKRLADRKRKISVSVLKEYCDDEETGCLPKTLRVIGVILPFVNLIFIVLWLFAVVSYVYPLFSFVITLFFSWLTKTATDKVLLPLYGINYVAGDYADMLRIFSGRDYNSKYLKDMREICAGPYGALKGFEEASKLGQAYNIMFNPLIHQLLSGLFLWDYRLAYFAGRWKRKYAAAISKGLDCTATLEALLSLSVVEKVRNTCSAAVRFDKQNELRLDCKDIYHPLLEYDKVQANSVSLESGITIITGSNMSGKTTFLRTLALNLVLAYAGAGVCAKAMEADYMKLYTSMRVTDDVANGISTFYAEILRIKGMAEYRKEEKPMLCLIDEIFKGTNSADRIVGATKVIESLAGELCMTVVSTHDFELCSMKDKKGNEVKNYHFEEHYIDDKLCFDYKIKDGRCTTTNARAILKMAGFDI